MGQNQYVEAEMMMTQAVQLEKNEKIQGVSGPDVLQEYNARLDRIRAKKQANTAQGPAWQDLLRTGLKHVPQKEFAVAESYINQALIEVSKPGNNPLDKGTVLGALGLLNAVECRFEKAEAYMNQAIAVTEAELGPDDATVQSMKSKLNQIKAHAVNTCN